MKNRSNEVDTSVFVFVMLFLHRILLFYSLDVKYTFDSLDYMTKNGFDCFSGKLDRYRLPVYPMIIEVFQKLFTYETGLIICIFQLLLSLLSLIFLYLTVKKVTKNKTVSLIISCLYSTLNAIAGWDKVILTESISLSLTVFALYGIVSFLMENKVRYAVLASGILVVGCFLRAVFVIYAGMFFGALILILITSLFSKKNKTSSNYKRNYLLSIGAASVPVILSLVYAFCFYTQFGAFTMSDSYLGQQLYNVIRLDMYKDCTNNEITKIADEITSSKIPEKAKPGDKILDPEIQQELQKIVDSITGSSYDLEKMDNYSMGRFYIMDKFSRDDVKAFVDVSMKNHRLINIQRMISNSNDKFITNRYISISYDRNTDILYSVLNDFISVITITMLHAFIVSIIEIILFFRYLLKNKEAKWIRLGLGAFILSTVLLSLIGTNDEYARTAITALPFMFVALSFYLKRAFQYLKKEDFSK